MCMGLVRFDEWAVFGRLGRRPMRAGLGTTRLGLGGGVDLAGGMGQ